MSGVPVSNSVFEIASWVRALLRGPQALTAYTVAGGLPAAAEFPNCMIYVSDETGGAVPCFSDGTNWRRVTDRAVAS